MPAAFTTTRRAIDRLPVDLIKIDRKAVVFDPRTVDR